MKQSNRSKSVPFQLPVHFEYMDPGATTVCLAGTFNNWSPESKPMHAMGGGLWQKESALAPGIYEYCLVVDGRWMPDPLARESVDNPYGGKNSILFVENVLEAAHHSDSVNSPCTNAGSYLT